MSNRNSWSAARAVAVAGLALVLVTRPALAAGIPIDNERSGIPTLAPILEGVKNGVVNIAVSSTVRVPRNPLMQDPFFRQFFGDAFGDRNAQPQERQVRAAGSGVIVDARNGYLLTNNHVVENADKITVTLADLREFDAKLVGTDAATDIAVLKIDAKDLTAVPLGQSIKAKVGDFVIAVGNPFGLGQTVTSGIISALGRGGLNIEGYEDFIQTDASINPGNSGGALIDMNGRLIGLNTAIIGPSGGNIGIGFAVSVEMAKSVMEQLLQYGEVKRGRIGVEVVDVTPAVAKELELKRNSGIAIMGVESGSSADKAGLRKGDVIVKLNGVDVRNTRELRNALALIRAGEKVEVGFARGDKTQTVKLELIPEPAKPSQRLQPAANQR